MAAPTTVTLRGSNICHLATFHCTASGMIFRIPLGDDDYLPFDFGFNISNLLSMGKSPSVRETIRV